VFTILSAVLFSMQGATPALHWVCAESELRYTAVHKLHTVEGRSHAAEAAATITDGRLQVMLRVPISSFDSQNRNRDAHIHEALDALKHPFATFKAIADGVQLPTPQAPVRWKLAGELELHGVRVPKMVEVDVTAGPAGELTATFEIKTLLTAHQVQRPELLFVAGDDELVVRGRIRMRPR
jgi:polyisoprenoid-binding protein YceI